MISQEVTQYMNATLDTMVGLKYKFRHENSLFGLGILFSFCWWWVWAIGFGKKVLENTESTDCKCLGVSDSITKRLLALKDFHRRPVPRTHNPQEA